MTRPVTVGQAGPRLEAGGTLGASLAANDRRLAEATLTLDRASPRRGRRSTRRRFSTRASSRPGKTGEEPLVEHVWAGGRDREISPIWEGDATLRFFESPADELAELAPVEVGRGFWFSFGYTVDGGRRVE